MAAMAELDHLNDRSILNRPTALEAILRETADLGFSASEEQTREWAAPMLDQLPPIAARNARGWMSSPCSCAT